MSSVSLIGLYSQDESISLITLISFIIKIEFMLGTISWRASLKLEVWHMIQHNSFCQLSSNENRGVTTSSSL